MTGDKIKSNPAFQKEVSRYIITFPIATPVPAFDANYLLTRKNTHPIIQNGSTEAG
jgi:hypothetical protein